MIYSNLGSMWASTPTNCMFSEPHYSEKSYKMASDNTKYNYDGKAVISENDEWRDEKEWDEGYQAYRL